MGIRVDRHGLKRCRTWCATLQAYDLPTSLHQQRVSSDEATHLHLYGASGVSSQAIAMSVLLVATSHSKLGNTDKQTGAWLEEIAAPFYVWQRAGLKVDVASPDGAPIPLDEGSLTAPFFTADAKLFWEDGDAMAKLKSPLSLQGLDVSQYKAVFIAGGHGIVYDGPDNADLKRVLEELFRSGRVVSAVCHGPAGLVSATGADGKSILNGRKCTGFTNAEEEAVQKVDVMPWLLEDKMKELGGTFEAAGNWEQHVVVDGNLVTGQNPQSSAALAKAVLQQIAA